MAEELRAKVVEGEQKSKRVLWIAAAIAFPILCCCGLLLLAWFSGDAILGLFGLVDYFQP